jgi:hypothetical protein
VEKRKEEGKEKGELRSRGKREGDHEGNGGYVASGEKGKRGIRQNYGERESES